jgi:hypothetical protein
MLNRLAAFALALTLTITGMPLCAGMVMDTAGASGHVCSHAGTRPGAVGDALRHDAPMPDPDCCLLGSAPGPRLPTERTATNAPNVLLPVPAALAPASPIPVHNPILLSTADPPGSPSLARHLVLCVFLM